MNRQEVIDALRAKGYTGPTSYTKSKLEEMLGGKVSESGKKAKITPPKPGNDNVIVYEYETLNENVEFRVTKQAAWFRFHSYVTTPAGESWISCYGGSGKTRMFRSFNTDRLLRDKKSNIMQRPTKKKEDE